MRNTYQSLRPTIGFGDLLRGLLNSLWSIAPRKKRVETMRTVLSRQHWAQAITHYIVNV